MGDTGGGTGSEWDMLAGVVIGEMRRQEVNWSYQLWAWQDNKEIAAHQIQHFEKHTHNQSLRHDIFK